MKALKNLSRVFLILILLVALNSCDNGTPVMKSVWDGDADTSWYVGGKTEYVIGEAKELAGLAELVNSGNTFEGATISLNQDIDLNNRQWTPIGSYSDTKPFSGTFDGNNHLISGLMSGNVKDEDNYSYRALFGYSKGTICNLIVEGNVTAADSAGIAAVLGGGTIDSVINKVNVSGSGNAGGIAALIEKDAGTCTIKNTDNCGSVTSSSGDTDDAVGGIIGKSEGVTLTLEKLRNYGSLTSSSLQYTGGIIGEVTMGDSTSVNIASCSNSASLTSLVNGHTGGIIGKLTYKTTMPKLDDKCTTSDSYSLIGTVEKTSTT